MRALISRLDKNGLEDFASGLAELGVELVASGGTADYLAEHGIEVDARRGADRDRRRCSAGA